MNCRHYDCTKLSLYLKKNKAFGLWVTKIIYRNGNKLMHCRAVCKVRGLTFLLRVGTSWRCGDGLFFEVPPLVCDSLLNNAPPTSRKCAADRWSLRNFLPQSSIFVVGKAQKSHGARSELNSVCGWDKVDRWNPLRTSVMQSRSRPIRFLGFSNHEKGAPRQEISKLSTVCSLFSRSGWSVVRNVSFAKGGTSKKRPSPHLYKVPTRINKVGPRNFQTALVFCLTTPCRWST
jgi:hypothetical protein